MIDVIFWFSIVVFILMNLLWASVWYTDYKEFRGIGLLTPKPFVYILWVLSLAGILSTWIVG